MPSKQPKITYLISQYPAISHTFILREVLHLKKEGMDVQVASINAADRDDSHLTAEERHEKEQTFYIKPQGAVGALKAIARYALKYPGSFFATFFYAIRLCRFDLYQLLYNLFYFVEAVMVAEWMTKTGSDHIHVHFASEVATVGLFAKKLAGASYSITVHGPDEFYDAGHYYLPEKIAAADFIFCISDFAKSQIMKLSDYEHWHKCVVCRLGVDPDVFKPVIKETPNDKTHILCVGRLCPAKGQHILLMAADKLKQQSTDFHLTFVGPGPDRESLEQLARKLELQEQVTFTGAINQDGIRDYYNQADIFCLPSFAEGIPIVLMEAMAKEIPCVTTHITGIPELFRNGIDGLLVTPSNVDELTAALTTLIKDSGVREKIGKAGRERVMDKYDLAHNTSYFGSEFKRLLEQRDNKGH